MAADGAPTDVMDASDIHQDLWELGFELFSDRDRMRAQFIQADIFEAVSGLGSLDGKMDIILACQLLHLWDWEKRLTAMRCIVRMSKVGTLVIGYQRTRKKQTNLRQPWGHMYIYDVRTFEEIWQNWEKKRTPGGE